MGKKGRGTSTAIRGIGKGRAHLGGFCRVEEAGPAIVERCVEHHVCKQFLECGLLPAWCRRGGKGGWRSLEGEVICSGKIHTHTHTHTHAHTRTHSHTPGHDDGRELRQRPHEFEHSGHKGSAQQEVAEGLAGEC
jgi:hypothetical protein